MIKAVYLTRGGAKGEILPLLSDLDFVVVDGGIDEEEKKSLFNSYDKLSRITTILNQPLEFYDEETFNKRYKNTHKQYRLKEAKETWRLLYGSDYVANLPNLSLEEAYGGLYAEIKLWWNLFSWRLLQSKKNNDEAVIRNNVCYKIVSEILKMTLALNHGTLSFSRTEALSHIKLYLSGKEKEMVEKLENIARNRFIVKNNYILSETTDFLINFINRFHSEFHAHPYALPLKKITQKIDGPEDEWLWGVHDRVNIEQLISYLKKKWAYTYRGAYVISGYYMLDELLLMIEVDPEHLPIAEDITEFYLRHYVTQSHLNYRMYVYILMPNVALQIDGDYMMGSWKSILCPYSNPDLFELLHKPESALDGGSYQSDGVPIWSRLIKDILDERKIDSYERLQSPSVYSLSNLDFLRLFWKTIQLIIITHSAQRDIVIYPFTLPAIERAMVIENITLPAHFQCLADSYRDELNGISSNIRALKADAISYVRGII